MADVTQILEALQQGEPKAADQLLPLVYEELRKLALGFARAWLKGAIRSQ